MFYNFVNHPVFQNTKIKTQLFGDRLHVRFQVKRVEGSTYSASAKR
jgi:hypothetical protein